MRPSTALEENGAAIRDIAPRHRGPHVPVFATGQPGDDLEARGPDLLVEPTAQTTLMDLAAIQVEAERLLGIHVDVLTPTFLPCMCRDRVLREAVPVCVST